MKEKRRGRYGADDDWLREMIGWWKDHSKSHLRVGGEPAELGIQPVGGGAGGGAEGRTRWRRVWPARERNAGCGRRCSPEGIWPGSLVGSFRLWGCVQRPRSRHPQTGLGAPTPILNRRVWVAPLTVSKYFSGESWPGLKPSPPLPAGGAGTLRDFRQGSG